MVKLVTALELTSKKTPKKANHWTLIFINFFNLCYFLKVKYFSEYGFQIMNPWILFYFFKKSRLSGFISLFIQVLYLLWLLSDKSGSQISIHKIKSPRNIFIFYLFNLVIVIIYKNIWLNFFSNMFCSKRYVVWFDLF